MRNCLSVVLLLIIDLVVTNGMIFGQTGTLRTQGAHKPIYHSLQQQLKLQFSGAIKYEETFPDTSALNWIILNDDQSSNVNGPTVGAFVSMLNFPNGTSVNPETPSTFFWASDFTNANGMLIDEWLVSPQLPIVEAGDTLRFYGGAPDNGINHDSIQVWISTVDPQGSSAPFSFNMGRFKMQGPTGTWHEIKIPLDDPAMIGSPVWLGIRYWHTEGGTSGIQSDNVWIDHILITNDATATVTQSFLSGWNLIGLPLVVEDSAAATLYPDHTPGTLFSYNGSYQSETHLSRCKGFWLNFPNPISHTVTGQPLESCAITLLDGWNLIAGPNCDVPLSAVSDPGNVITPGTLFGFNGAYVQSDTLKSGNGYWVLANGVGQISMNCSVAGQSPKISAQPFDLTGFPALKISDASQHSQTLYFDVRLPQEINRRVFSLPPVAPAGISAFDARFSGDLRIAETNEALIELQASDFPLTIRGDKLPGAMEIMEMIGRKEIARHILPDGGVVQISNPAVNRLKLATSGAALPNRFALLQNYPNPFNPSTEIQYELPQKAVVRLVIYNALGQVVKTLISREQEAGNYRVVWDGRDEHGVKTGSGVYVYRLKAGSFSAAKKMVLLQ